VRCSLSAICALMKRPAFGLLIIGLHGVFVESLYAGSAVAIANNGQRTIIVKSYGLPKKVAERDVIEICRGEGGVNAKVLASSSIVGYGAIAVSRRGPEWVVGVSLGRKSASESETRAIKACLRAGGINPKVKWGFRG
jgi:hypothetical protein